MSGAFVLGVKLLIVMGVAAVVFGDTSTAAVIAGVFSVLNTVLVLNLRRGVRETHKILTAPRRALYDDQGRIIGTMLRLDTGDDWMGRIVPPQRASDLGGENDCD